MVPRSAHHFVIILGYGDKVRAAALASCPSDAALHKVVPAAITAPTYTKKFYLFYEDYLAQTIPFPNYHVR